MMQHQQTKSRSLVIQGNDQNMTANFVLQTIVTKIINHFPYMGLNSVLTRSKTAKKKVVFSDTFI